MCARKGAERLVELLVDGDEAAEILDAEPDAVCLGQIVQVLPDFFERDRHITTPFYHLSEVQHRTEVWSSYSADLSRNHAENSMQKAEKLAMIGLAPQPHKESGSHKRKAIIAPQQPAENEAQKRPQSLGQVHQDQSHPNDAEGRLLQMCGNAA